MHSLMLKIYEELPRQGPGDRQSTARALRMVPGLPASPEILDLGCGTGAQTLDLAALTPGQITAVDNHAPFLDKLSENAAAKGLANRIRTLCKDMAELDFPRGSFDLIWSEGAAYQMGFENALKDWRRLLRPGGSLILSEIVWLVRNPPAELVEYLKEECPDMQLAEDNLPLIQSAGYELTGQFKLPDESWWTDYYTPLEKTITQMRDKHRGDADAESVLDVLQTEINMHRKYASCYAYVFYVMKRTG